MNGKRLGLEVRTVIVDFVIAVLAGLVVYYFTNILKVSNFPSVTPYLLVPIPIGVVLVVFVVLILISYGIVKLRKAGKGREDILSTRYGRRFVTLCQEPRTTSFLKQQYEQWESQSPAVVIGGYHFDDYLRELKKGKYLKYQDSHWSSTPKALRELQQYHGFAD